MPLGTTGNYWRQNVSAYQANMPFAGRQIERIEIYYFYHSMDIPVTVGEGNRI